MHNTEPAPAYRLGDYIKLSRSDSDAYLVSGFSFREDWGRWTDGPTACVRLEHGKERGLLLVEIMIGRAFCHDGELCDLIIQTGWSEPKLFSLGPDAMRVAVLVAAEETDRPGVLDITMFVVRPKQLNEPPDARALGIGIETIRVTRIGSTEQISN